MKKHAFVSSPLAGNVMANKEKAREYCKIVYAMGYIPVCPHLMTSWLDDTDAEQRKRGMEIALGLLERCDILFVCGNVISKGMKVEIDTWGKDRPVLHLQLGDER